VRREKINVKSERWKVRRKNPIARIYPPMASFFSHLPFSSSLHHGSKAAAVDDGRGLHLALTPGLGRERWRRERFAGKGMFASAGWRRWSWGRAFSSSRPLPPG